jgi:Ni/Co efflux regulator RcnB
MKRAALGALLISLVAGSTAMAGTVLAPAYYGKYGGQQHQVDNRQHDNRNDDRQSHRGRDNWNHRDDHRNDRRWDGRRDDHQNDRRWDGRRGDYRSDRRYDPPRYSPPPRRYDPPRFNNRPYSERRWENGRWHWGSYYRPQGYYVRHWVRGDRLPHTYYGPTYIVGNYYDCGLRRPPYGYHWVRIDHDVVLAAVATGIVLDVVYNQFW